MQTPAAFVTYSGIHAWQIPVAVLHEATLQWAEQLCCSWQTPARSAYPGKQFEQVPIKKLQYSAIQFVQFCLDWHAPAAFTMYVSSGVHNEHFPVR